MAANKNYEKLPLTVPLKRKRTRENGDLVLVPKKADLEKFNPVKALSILKPRNEGTVSNVEEPPHVKSDHEVVALDWSDGCTFKCNKCKVTSNSRSGMGKHCIASGHGRMNSHKLIIKETYVCKLCDNPMLHESNVISDHMQRIHKSTLEKYGNRFHSGKNEMRVNYIAKDKIPYTNFNEENKDQTDEIQVEDLVPVTILNTYDREINMESMNETTHSIFGNMPAQKEIVGEHMDKSPSVMGTKFSKSSDTCVPKEWNEGCFLWDWSQIPNFPSSFSFQRNSEGNLLIIFVPCHLRCVRVEAFLILLQATFVYPVHVITYRM